MFNKSKFFKIGSFILSIMVVLLMAPVQNVSASTFSVSAQSSVNANTDFTVSFGSGTTGAYSYSVSGGTIVSSEGWVEGNGSLTVKSGASGTVSVTVTAVNVTDTSYNDVTGSKSVSVSINASEPSDSSASNDSTDSSSDNASGSNSSTNSSSNNTTSSNSSTNSSSNNTTNSNSSTNNSSNNTSSANTNSTTSEQKEVVKSSDNTLKSLSIEGVELSPAFSSGTTSYTAEVWDNASVTVSASGKDSKATVSGTGKKDLALGDNKIEVKVTAENGSVKIYTINVFLNQNPTIFMEYNDKNLGVVKNIVDIDAFSGFDRCIVEYEMQELEGWYSSLLDMTILYMIDESDEVGFYIIKDGEIISELQEVDIKGVKYYIVALDEDDQKREGFVYDTVTMDDLELMGWLFESEALSNYRVIQLMGIEGNVQDYLYSVIDGNMIRYPDMAPVSVDDYVAVVNESVEQADALEQLKLLATILAGVAAVLLICLIIAIIKIVKSKRLLEVLEEVEEEYMEAEEEQELEEFDYDIDEETL